MTVAVILLSATALAWLTWVLVRGPCRLGRRAGSGHPLPGGRTLGRLRPHGHHLHGRGPARRGDGVASLRWPGDYRSLRLARHAHRSRGLGPCPQHRPRRRGGHSGRRTGRVHPAPEWSSGPIRRRKVEVATAKAEVEQTRAELLGERNHLAREIHDVLAHTLACSHCSSRRSPPWSTRSPTPVGPCESSSRRPNSWFVKDSTRPGARSRHCATTPLLDDQLVPARSPSGRLHGGRPAPAASGSGRHEPLPGGPGGADQRHEARSGRPDRGAAGLRARHGRVDGGQRGWGVPTATTATAPPTAPPTAPAMAAGSLR